MTLQEMQQTEWYKSKPEVIKKAFDILPPIQMYKFKNSGYQCYIVSIEEPESGKLEDVTCTVQKTGCGGYLDNDFLGLRAINTNKVFGVGLYELEVWDRKNDIL